MEQMGSLLLLLPSFALYMVTLTQYLWVERSRIRCILLLSSYLKIRSLTDHLAVHTIGYVGFMLQYGHIDVYLLHKRD